jgi:hypothetical protein
MSAGEHHQGPPPSGVLAHRLSGTASRPAAALTRNPSGPAHHRMAIEQPSELHEHGVIPVIAGVTSQTRPAIVACSYAVLADDPLPCPIFRLDVRFASFGVAGRVDWEYRR